MIFFKNFKNFIFKITLFFKSYCKKIPFNNKTNKDIKKNSLGAMLSYQYLAVLILLLNPIIPYIVLLEFPISILSSLLNGLAIEFSNTKPSQSKIYEFVQTVSQLFLKYYNLEFL